MGSGQVQRGSIIEALSQPGFTERFNEILAQIGRAQGQARVTAALHDAVRLMGFDGGAFLSFIRSDESRESFKFTVACSPTWCQTYSENAWYLADPGLVYAQSNSTPVLVQDLPLRTPMQREIIESAKGVGFVSGVVVPSHTSSGRNRLGVLYLGSSTLGFIDKNSLQVAKLYLRALSSDLLDWWNQAMRESIQRQVQLSESDLQLMRMCEQGYRTKEIAEILGSDHTPGAIDQRIARIIARMGADGRKDAVRKLVDVGLLGA